MIRRVSRSGLTLLALAVLPSAGLAESPDRRIEVVVRQECLSSLGRLEITLFGNGTVRIREGRAGDETLLLGEATPEEVEAFVRRLSEPDLSETDPVERSPVGSWVESCVLELALPDRPPARFHFGRYGSTSLALETILSVVRDIEGKARESSSESRLPAGYEPRTGDLLERVDGIRFEVVGRTADGLGVELSSPDQPLTLYVPLTDLRSLFLRLLEPQPGPGG